MAVIGFLVCSSTRLMVLEEVALVRSQTGSIRKWAFSHRMLYLQSRAKLILIGWCDVIENYNLRETRARKNTSPSKLARNLPSSLLLIDAVEIPFSWLNCHISYRT